MALEDIINKDGEEVQVNWEQFHQLYESAKKIDTSDFKNILKNLLEGASIDYSPAEREFYDYGQVCSSLMYFEILHFNPKTDCLKKEEMNYEIVGGYENENLNPRLLSMSKAPVLYFNYIQDAREYQTILLKTAKKNLYPIQIRKVEIIEFDTG